MTTEAAPERIWVESETAYYRIAYKDRKMRDGEVEYIRADLVATPAQVTLSPEPDIQQIIDYLDAAQYYFPEDSDDRKALKAASNILATPAQGDANRWLDVKCSSCGAPNSVRPSWTWFYCGQCQQPVKEILRATPAQGDSISQQLAELPLLCVQSQPEVFQAIRKLQEQSRALPQVNGDSIQAAEAATKEIKEFAEGLARTDLLYGFWNEEFVVERVTAIITRHCGVKLSKFQCQECGSTNLLEDVTDKIFPTCVR